MEFTELNSELFRKPEGEAGMMLAAGMSEKHKPFYDETITFLKEKWHLDSTNDKRKEERSLLEIGPCLGKQIPRYFNELDITSYIGVEVSETLFNVLQLDPSYSTYDTTFHLIEKDDYLGDVIHTPTKIDAFVMHNVIYFIDDANAYLTSLRMLAKEHAQLIIGIKSPEQIKDSPFDTSMLNLRTKEEIAELCQSVGLHGIQILSFDTSTSYCTKNIDDVKHFPFDLIVAEF